MSEFPAPIVVRTVAELRQTVAAWRAQGESVALVPTMGALHQGHLTLVERARQRCRRVCVSVFVNPAQFAPGEDFQSYPRDEAGDLAKLATVGTDLVYAPAVGELYPEGFATRIIVGGPAEGLCGAARPLFFGGVATVVTKLFNQVAPDLALFGEKDYQQLQVIRRLVRDLDLPLAIEGVPTVREADGLALSSRNAYLTAEERARAPELQRTLTAAAAALTANRTPAAQILEQARVRLTAAGFGPIDYLELRDAETLAPLERAQRPARLLVAARLGRARLIDNVPVAPAVSA